MQISLVGASPDTGNLGVSALCLSTVQAIFRVQPAAQVTVFDEGRGCRRAVLASNGETHGYKLCGEKYSRRIWQAESLANIRISCRLGGLWNASARAILGSDAILDISGGDSFTDLYGPHRFRAVTLLKEIVLENGIPLILLPQTYGPFAQRRHREIAERIVRRSRMAWARDARSHEVLRQLAGPDFDAQRHCSGVDVAFGLDAVQPETPLPDSLASWLRERSEPVAGLNISGLIFNEASAGRQFSLRADYRAVVRQLLERLLEEARVVLVPHVVTPPGHYESDIEACRAVADQCGGEGERLCVLPAMDDPRQVKWVIGKLDWFCGTRMHSTIAGLSQGVPTAAIAYSLKTQGVFETCGQGAHVADPRSLGTEEVVERLVGSWRAREEARRSLAGALPGVLRRAAEQMEVILTQGAAAKSEHGESRCVGTSA